MSVVPLVLQEIIKKTDGEYNIFIEDLKKVSESEHSLETLKPIYSTIDLVYVLSGRGSALKKAIDHTTVDDMEDDYYRILKGIEIANQIYRNKGIRVPIFYNGRNLHNKHLRIALDQGIFDYPKELFIIKPIFPENTIGQARSFKEFLKYENYSTIAIVTNAYHLTRVSRTFGKQSPTVSGVIEPANLEKVDEPEKSYLENMVSEGSNLEKTNLLLFGIDRSYQRPGVARDLRGEIDAMKNYSSGKTATISRRQGDNTFLNKTDVLFQWSFNLQRRQPHGNRTELTG